MSHALASTTLTDFPSNLGHFTHCWAFRSALRVTNSIVVTVPDLFTFWPVREFLVEFHTAKLVLWGVVFTWFPSSCPVIIVDTSIFNPSDGGMGENTSSGPSCSSLYLALLISRQTNLERHFSPFILSTHFSMRGLQPLQLQSFSQTHPSSSYTPFLLSVRRSTTSGQSMCHRHPISLRAVWCNRLHPAPDLQSAVHQLWSHHLKSSGVW